MTKRKFAFLAGAITGSLLSVAAPAQAATGLVLMPTAFAVASLRLPELHADCSSAVPNSASATSGFQTKSQAILSGQVSRLDQITIQQQGLSKPTATVTSATAYSPASSISNGSCQGFAQPLTSLSSTPLGARTIEPILGDFLGSKRLLVHWTPLDTSWNRVRSSTLSSKYAEALIGPVKGPVSVSTILAVNAWTNKHIRYVEDQVQYGKADYWADARTTLRHRAGDCEDIAIAKMQLLAALGMNRSDMYLTIARDLVRNADHALLIVKLDGHDWLLDDSTDALLNADSSFDYRPIMTFSQNNSWIHGYTNLALNVR